ncbi:MAG: glycosyltransferase family 4 protein [Magnetococcus sp. WYHC-3]
MSVRCTDAGPGGLDPGSSLPCGAQCRPCHPPHVLLVYRTAFPAVRGGIDAMLLSLVRALPSTGWRVSLLVPAGWDEPPGPSRSEVHGVTVFRMRLRSPRDRYRPWRGVLGWLRDLPEQWRTLRRLMIQEGVTLVHLQTLQEEYVAFRLLRMLGGPPLLLTFHGSDANRLEPGGGLRGWLLRQVVGGVDAVSAVSDMLAAVVASRYPRWAPVPAVANGLDPAAVASLPPVPPEWAGCWVQVGWLAHHKAPDVAVRAWAEVVRQRPELTLLLVGDAVVGDDYLPALRGLIAQLGLQHQVHLTGAMPREQALAVVRAGAGLLFTSRGEGLPYVLLEAGLLQQAVICSRIPAFAGFIEHGVDGWLVPVNDPAALAEAVLRLSADTVLAHNLGRALGEKVRSRYGAEAMARGYAELYRRIGGGSGT